MSMNIRYPNITGATEREQLFQMKSYLRQLVDQLNYEMQTQSQDKSTVTGSGANGKNGKDGKDGEAGKDGKTPQKGVDYWTEADVQQIVSETTAEVLAQKATILAAAMPVGYIYISTASTNPKTLFGFGTWEQMKDRFLLAAGSKYTAGSTGGAATHTLTVDEMPSHTHKLRGESASVASGSSYARFSGSGSAEFSSIANTGGSLPHNNMPPYITVYVWKRTA